MKLARHFCLVPTPLCTCERHERHRVLDARKPVENNGAMSSLDVEQAVDGTHNSGAPQQQQTADASRGRATRDVHAGHVHEAHRDRTDSKTPPLCLCCMHVGALKPPKLPQTVTVFKLVRLLTAAVQPAMTADT